MISLSKYEKQVLILATTIVVGFCSILIFVFFMCQFGEKAKIKETQNTIISIPIK